MSEIECFKCDICWSSFMQQNDLQRHKRFHTNRRQQCFVCLRMLADLPEFHEHQRTHELQNRRKTPTLRQTEKCERKHSKGQLHRCRICLRLFTDLLSLRVHQRLRKTRKLRIKTYNEKIILSRPSVLELPSGPESEQKPSESQSFVSDLRKKPFRNPPSIQKHLGQHELQSAQESDSLRSSASESLMRHKGLKKQISKHQCPICHVLFSDIFELREHRELATCEIKKECVNDIFKCRTCRESLPGFREFWDHQKKCKPFECEFCFTRFENNQLLQNHRAKFTEAFETKKKNDNDSIFRSKICDASFIVLGSLLTDQLNDCTPFECEFCHKRFENKERLEKHRTKVTNGSFFKCDVCCKAFRWISNFLRHKRRSVCCPIVKTPNIRFEL